MQDIQQPTNITILPLFSDKSGDFFSLIDKMGIQRDYSYIENMLERQSIGEVEILLAQFNSLYVGYCILNWRPKYSYFRLQEIPEIQDLRVVRDFRQRGIGTALINECETRAALNNLTEIGIGVGLDSSFGPAQRLYVKLGYIPDGNGISYDRKLVSTGDFRPIDDNLCLMLVKKLG